MHSPYRTWTNGTENPVDSQTTAQANHFRAGIGPNLSGWPGPTSEFKTISTAEL